LADNQQLPPSPAELMKQLIATNGDLVQVIKKLDGDVTATKEIAGNKNAQLREAVAFSDAVTEASEAAIKAAKGGYGGAAKDFVAATKIIKEQAENLESLVGTIRDQRQQMIWVAAAFIAGILVACAGIYGLKLFP
jgi:hypothetical protein